MAAAIIAICLSGFFIFKILSPKTKEEQITLYNYTMTAGGSYIVHLKENEIYNEMLMKENMIYPKSIFDKLSVKYYAEFSGSTEVPSNVKADYTIEIQVRGFQIKGDEKRIIYEKIFPLSEHTNMKFSKKAYITEEITLDFNEYESYINNVKSIIQADPSSEAQMIFRGNFNAVTEYGNKEEQFIYTINLPLFESLFTIDKPADIEKTGSITETALTEIKPDKLLLIIPVFVIFIMLLFIAYIMMFTLKHTDDENRALFFKSIMKKHGSRIVKAERFIGPSGKKMLIIKDIEGMVKISDELNAPIFYIPDISGMPDENGLFIQGEDMNYTYYITGSKASVFMHTTT